MLKRIKTAGFVLIVAACAPRDDTVRPEQGSSLSNPSPVPYPAPLPVPSPPNPQSTFGIFVSQKDLQALPTAGAAWNAMLAEAGKPCSVPSLANQDDPTNICVLVKALVYARTPKENYYSGVAAALRGISISGTYSGRALALGRELAAYVIAADLVNLKIKDPALDKQFRVKIRELRTTPTDGGPANLIECHEQRPNNWGTHCGASRAAVSAYLGDNADLTRAKNVFLGWLGDRSVYSGFSFGDLSWQCDASRPVGINAKSCMISGRSVDGVLPDDQRRAGGFTWPPPKENYVWEALQGAVVQAVIYHRAGYKVFDASDKALLRSLVWLHSQSNFPAEGDDTWIPHIINAFYGTSFPAPSPSQPGKNFGFSDWIYGK